VVGLDLPDGLSAFYGLALRLKYRDKSDAILEKALPMSHALPFLTNSKVREIVRPLKQPALIVRWIAIRGFVTKVEAGRTEIANRRSRPQQAAYLAGGSVGIVCAMRAYLILDRTMGS
jgi:hypothetical protein